jgi:hypothetical protein
MADTATAAGRMLLALSSLAVAVKSLPLKELDIAATREEKLLALLAENRTDTASMLAMMLTAAPSVAVLLADIAR